MAQRVVVRLLKDGTGRVRIHWFVRADHGPHQTPGGVTMTNMGPLALAGFPATPGQGARGYIACNKELSPLPGMKAGVVEPTIHSDDPRAVTCPECLATAELKAAMAEMADIEETAHHGSAEQLKAAAAQVGKLEQVAQ